MPPVLVSPESYRVLISPEWAVPSHSVTLVLYSSTPIPHFACDCDRFVVSTKRWRRAPLRWSGSVCSGSVTQKEDCPKSGSDSFHFPPARDSSPTVGAKLKLPWPSVFPQRHTRASSFLPPPPPFLSQPSPTFRKLEPGQQTRSLRFRESVPTKPQYSKLALTLGAIVKGPGPPLSRGGTAAQTKPPLRRR